MDQDHSVIWTLGRRETNSSSMARFMDVVNKKYNLSIASYRELHAWSVGVKTANNFWLTLFDFLDLRPTVPPTRALEADDLPMFPTPRFFTDAKMNFAGSVLSNRDPNEVAIIQATEGSLETRSITWEELNAEVERIVDAMRVSGVKNGDRVAAVIANTPQAITLCLATLSIGAIWSSVSPDFGPHAIIERLKQIDPVLIFAESSVTYNGNTRDLMSTVSSWANTLSKSQGLRNIVINRPTQAQVDAVPKGLSFEGFLRRGVGVKLTFEQLPFSHPAFIFYSSGTTGTPKCILHTAGGVMLQVKKDYVLHIGVLPTDTLFQYTTTAWIMWAFVLTAMSIGTKIVVYDGSPLYPDVRFLLKLLAHTRVSVFGTSAKHLTELMDKDTKPRDEVDLSSLRRITSTGSVLPADVARWVYDKGFPRDIHLVSGSGGTDCSCSFVTGSPIIPLWSDEIQCKSLGMDVDVFEPLSDQQKSIANSGEAGELVCKKPFPSQPLTFWGKGGQEKYHDAYFSMFGNKVWVQGDLVSLNPETGGFKMLGRSDGVLNPSGVRFGSAEIYNVVRAFPEVEDSVCVGQRREQDRDESVLLFLKLKVGERQTNALKTQLKQAIGKGLSKRHVPKHIFYVKDIPYSIAGKKLEILVKNIVSGRDATSNVVANPESLEHYRNFYEIEKAAETEDVEPLKSKI
ncbi:acetoacetyl-synthase [Ilyonectria sp. MPI-CAGE-AT-0026]|nr:acetoacetyl-synthase [Ilyonectria sp. MPI-CAGE-AT-0026]